MCYWLKLSWKTRNAFAPDWLARVCSLCQCKSLNIQAWHRQCMHTVEKQRKALFLPQWIYILGLSVSSWHLVHAAISRQTAVKALHPFTISMLERAHLYWVTFLKTKPVKTFWIANFINQNEREKKLFHGNFLHFSNHSIQKGALKKIEFKEYLQLTEHSSWGTRWAWSIDLSFGKEAVIYGIASKAEKGTPLQCDHQVLQTWGILAANAHLCARMG